MFLGEYSHSCDSKNRLRLPTKFKKESGSGFVLTKGSDGCVFVMPKDKLDSIFEKANQLPMFDSSVQKPLRLLFSSACELEEDAQGRFLLPQSLKEFAGIKKEVVFVGAGTRIELWAKERWIDYSMKNLQDFETLAQELGRYGV